MKHAGHVELGFRGNHAVRAKAILACNGGHSSNSLVWICLENTRRHLIAARFVEHAEIRGNRTDMRSKGIRNVLLCSDAVTSRHPFRGLIALHTIVRATVQSR